MQTSVYTQITEAVLYRYSTEKSFRKFRKILRNTSAVEYYISKVVGNHYFIKIGRQYGAFLDNFPNTYFYKTHLCGCF